MVFNRDFSANIGRKFSQGISGFLSAVAARLPDGLKSGWNNLPVRDRNALKLLSGVLFLVLLYLTIWQPVMQKVEERRDWQAKQSERLERAQLAAYNRLNQFGMIDLLPMDLWLKQELPVHRLSLIQHKAAGSGAQSKQTGQLQIRYSDSRKAHEFLVAMSRFAKLSQIDVDQSRRTISFNYLPDPDYVDLTQ